MNIVDDQWRRYTEKRDRIMFEWVMLCAGILATVVLWGAVILLTAQVVNADTVDMSAIRMIESSDNASAYNTRSQARGLYQITPICLKEWNNYHPHKTFNMDELWDADINEQIAQWYLNVRIPAMLRHYGKQINTRNVLVSYNAGISYVVKDRVIPNETEEYLKKYARLTK